MKKRMAALLILTVFLLTGCMNKPAGVDDLLRAPRLNGQQSGVQKALAAYLGETPQLKYPARSLTGEVVSPFVMEDFNGDGAQDAAVFYVSTAKGQNVHIAILEQKSSGEWYVTQEKEGLAPAVESISTAEIQPGMGRQLLVGYSGSGEKYLAVYAYLDNTLREVLSQPYSQYQLHPLGDESANDLIVIGPEQESPLQLQLLTVENGQFNLNQQLDLKEEFLSCDGLYPSMEKDGSSYLVMDGQTGSGLASLILRYNSEQRRLENFVPSTVESFFTTTQRFSSYLRSTDIDGDGRVEIPCQVDAGEVGALTVNKLSLVSWMDFTGDTCEEVRFGVADLEYGYFLALPSELKGSIMIASGDEPDSWQVCSLDGEEVYITVRVVAPGVQGNSYFRLGNIGAQKVQARISARIGVTTGDLVAGFFAL